MATQRKNIRTALVAMLTGNTSAGPNVYANRTAPSWRSELPLILIYAQNESGVGRDVSNRTYIRTMSLVIEIRAEANDNLDDTLDDLATEVEAIIRADVSLQGSSLGTLYTSTEMDLDSDGERQVGKLTLNFETKYIE